MVTGPSGTRWFRARSRVLGFLSMWQDIQGNPDNGRGGGLARKLVSPDRDTYKVLGPLFFLSPRCTAQTAPCHVVCKKKNH